MSSLSVEFVFSSGEPRRNKLTMPAQGAALSAASIARLY
jgi:hypothetical protein